MRSALCLLTACAVLCSSAPAQDAKPDEKPAAKPKQTSIPISKETTWLTEPLKADGSVDYVKALNQMASAGVTPETNAAVPLISILPPDKEVSTPWLKKATPMLGIEPYPDGRAFYKDLGDIYKEEHADKGEDWIGRNINDAWDVMDRARERPWTREELPLIAKWMDANEAVMETFAEGLEREKFYVPYIANYGEEDEEQITPELIAVLLPVIQSTREFARFLTARAMLCLGEGDVDAALEDLYLCHRLGHMLGENSWTLIESLVGIAIDSIAFATDAAVLDSGQATPKQLLAYRTRLRGLPNFRPMAKLIGTGERMMFLDAVFSLERGGPNVLNQLALIGALSFVNDEPDGRMSPLGKWLMGAAIDWAAIMKKGNTWYDRLEKVGSIESYPEQTRAWEQIEMELVAMRERVTNMNLGSVLGRLMNPRKATTDAIGDVLVSLLLPALQQATAAERRLQAKHDVFDVAVALVAYQAEMDAYPKSLAALAPKYIARVPDDTYTDKSLNYEVQDGGFVIYSVGQNGIDDGGLDWNDRKMGEDYDDIKVRLPLPEWTAD